MIRLNNINTKNAIYELFCIRATSSEYKEFIKKHDMNIINRVNERFDKIERNLNFYQCAISRTFEQIQILDEEMIPEHLHNELLPLPKYSR